MRTRHPGFGLLVLLTLSIGFWLPAPAQASVNAGLKIRWFGERPRPAQAGQEFVGQIELIAPRAGMVESLEFVGAGWTRIGMDAPTNFPMTHGQRRVIGFRLVAQDPSQALTVRC